MRRTGSRSTGTTLATNCPEYKVTAVQVMPVFHSSEWQSRVKQFTAQQTSLLDSVSAPASGHERRTAGEHLDGDGGDGLDRFILEAIRSHRAELAPKAARPG
jgi:hypothetical protein